MHQCLFFVLDLKRSFKNLSDFCHGLQISDKLTNWSKECNANNDRRWWSFWRQGQQDIGFYRSPQVFGQLSVSFYWTLFPVGGFIPPYSEVTVFLCSFIDPSISVKEIFQSEIYISPIKCQLTGLKKNITVNNSPLSSQLIWE